MLCRKCRKEIPDGAIYCQYCGAKQGGTQRPKSRGNAQGSAYKLPNGTFRAVVTLGYTVDAQGKKRRKTRSKDGFKTKKAALDYLPQLRAAKDKPKSLTLQQLYDRWLPTHRAGKDTINCYKAASRYFHPLWHVQLADIDIDDLQACMDECPKGKRTHENMKALCGLMYKYAIPRGLASLNLGQYLIVDADAGAGKVGLPVDILEKLKKAIGTVPYADYIVAQCYLGFRPSELLALNVHDYDPVRRAFVGGAKTDAGRDRVVTVSPKIQPTVDALVAARKEGQLFCAQDGGVLSLRAYRAAFYAALEAVGAENPTHTVNGVDYHTYTPHSCRHTFATLLKDVNAPSKDKLELIGHTSEAQLRHYQDVDIDALRRITDAL